MVKGLLADIHAGKHVAYVVRLMQADPWSSLWQDLGLVLRRFDEVGLAPNSNDLEIWHRCQQEQLILITNNRNDDGDDSLEATIRTHNTSLSLPVFTIGDFDKLASNRAYADSVVAQLYDYLIDIDNVRGTGRLYLP